MSCIRRITIKNYKGIKFLSQDFGKERFVVLIGRGDLGKSTILSAIHAVLSPSWNITFSDLDFHNQDTSCPIEIEAELYDIPNELLTDRKFGLYIANDLKDGKCQISDFSIIIKLSVDESLEPHWVVKARHESELEDKVISAQDRALFAVNFISDYTDNQFAYNKLSPLYSLTKSSLDNNKQIDYIKSQTLRAISASVSDTEMIELNRPLSQLTTTAKLLGLSLGNLSAGIDIKENPYSGNSIALHETNENVKLPFRLHGKGSKRLMSLAIQMDLSRVGGIALIDEIEQGLEPDRIATLVRLFKRMNKGQVFITTHSMNVILETNASNLFILNKNRNSLFQVSNDMNDCRRSNPQAFFGKKLIVCEGKTECGFLRSLDSWIEKKYDANFSTNGVVIVNAGGGDKIYTYSLKLKELGYDVCVFADNDVSEELKNSINSAKEASIPLFLCEKGYCLEKEVIISISWNAFVLLTQCSQENFPYNNIEITAEMQKRIQNASQTEDREKIREEIFKKATQKRQEWFKHIQGGEFLGNLVMDDLYNMSNENNLKKNLVELIKWCGFGEN